LKFGKVRDKFLDLTKTQAAMEQDQEDRKEPIVEVEHFDDYHPPSGNRRPARPPFNKKRLWVPVLLGAAVLLAFGLWQILPADFFSGKRPSESSEIKSLREEIQKLKGEGEFQKKEIQGLKEGQKVFQEQVTALEDQLKLLAKRPEPPAEKKAAPPKIVYKTQKGDSLESIARKFRVRPEDIRRWNRLPQAYKAKPGRTLTLFPPTP
jgi:LysM repeat protein